MQISVTRLLADLYNKVHETTALEKKEVKDEIRVKKEEVKEGYNKSASTQYSQGTLSKRSGSTFFLATVISAFIPTDPWKTIFKAISDSGSQVINGFQTNLNGRVTQLQGYAQIDQKELDLFHSKLQEVGNNLHAIQQLLESTQRDEKQAIGG